MALHLLFTLLLTAAATAAQSTIGPSSPLLRDYGRVDHTYPNLSRFSWVMAGVGCRITNATSLSANFSAPKSGARLRVMVDGVFERFIVVGKDKSKGPSQGPGLHTYAVAASLRADTTHTVQIFKVSDEGDVSDEGGEALRGGGGGRPRTRRGTAVRPTKITRAKRRASGVARRPASRPRLRVPTSATSALAAGCSCTTTSRSAT